MPKKYASVLDYPRPGLDGAVWSPDATLLPQHKDKIVESVMSHLLSAGFQSPQYWIDDIYLVGSLTTYQYLPTTDVDVHVSVNLKNFIEHETPVLSDQEAHDLLDALRKKFNPEKATLDGTKHPLELYFETPVAFKGRSDRTGVYSVMTDEWLVPPVSVDADFDIETMNPYFIDLAEQLAGEFDLGLGKLNRDVNRAQELSEVIQTWSPEQRTKFEEKLQQRLLKIEQEIQDLILKKDQITKERQNYSPESEQEIKFKYVQRFGYFAIISALKELVKDDGKVTEDELPEIEKILDKKAADSKYTHGYCAEYAVALSEKLGKPLGVIRGHFADDEDVEDAYQDAHAFVFISDTVGMDAKGERPIQDMINETAWVEKPTEIDAVKADLANLEFSFGTIDRDIVEEAKATIGKTAALKPKVVQVETFTIGGGTVKVVVAQDALDHYLNSIKNFYNNPNLMDADDARRAAHETALESALSLTDFHGEDPYLYASNVRDALSNFAEEMFNKKYGSLKKTAGVHMWLDPNGKEYSTQNYTHSDWIYKNTDMLHQKYGLEYTGSPMALYKEMLMSGWTRVTDDHGDLGLQVGSLNKIPPYLDDFILDKEPNISMEEYDGGFMLELTNPYPSLQDAVKKELRRARIPKAAIQAEFSPSIAISPPTNEWQSDSDLVLPQDVDPVSDEQTLNNPIVDKPRKGIWRSLIDWFIKRKHKEAMSDHAAWIDPKGKVYKVRSGGPGGTHRGWIEANADLLRKEYGYEIPHEQGWMSDKTALGLFDSMLKDGWIRVGDSLKSNQYISFQVPNMRNIPSYADDYLATFYKDGMKVEVEEGGNYTNVGKTVALESPFPTLQKAVNKALVSSLPLAADKKAAFAVDDEYWIGPDGDVHPAPNGHKSWIAENLGTRELPASEFTIDTEPLMEQYYDGNPDGLQKVLVEMLKMGWVRIGTDEFGSTQFIVEVANLRAIPQTAEQFVVEHFDAKSGEPIYVGDYAEHGVEIHDPFPSLQKAVNKALVGQRQKAAAFELQYWLDPNGQEYEGDALKDENVKPEQLIRSGWVQVLMPSDRQGIVLVVDELEFTPDHVNNFLAKTVGHGDPVTVKDTKGSTVTLRYPFKNIRGLIKKYLYAPEQEKAAALGSQSIWISPDGKEHQATYSHADWAFDNADFLSKNYGINLVVPEILDDLDDMEVARYHSDILNTLIEAGWVRVFIYGSQINFQISDMEHPPKSAEAFFDNHAHAFDRVVVEDYASAESVEIIKPDLGLARGIAHALRTQNQLAASSTKIPVEAFLKQASSGRYWIDPNGKEYNVPGTHTAWVGRNAEKLNKNFGYDLPLGVKHGHEYTNMLIDNGWVRIGHSNFGTEQFVVDVKDINNIPSTVDNFIAEHFNPNYKAPILVGSGIGKAVTVNDPFPSIQEAVNTELKFSKHSYLKKRGEHDYDPSWDYEVNTKVKPKIKSLVNAIISNWGELLKTLDLAKPSVHFVNNLGEGTIAMYVNGTYTAPVLLLDIDATVEAVKGYDISLETAIETSLLHELGHAWQDSVDYEYDEDEAEHFAQEYYNTGGISLPIEEAQKSLAEDPTRHDPSISASLLTASASSDIMKLIQETGGASYNLQSGNLAGTEMYAVSTHPERSVTLDHIPTEEEIDSYLNQNKDILSGENSFGAWFNKDNGKTYLDIVTTLPDRDKAIELGKKHNQIAIFDLKNFVEIPTGGTGEVVSKQAKSIEEVRGIKVLVNPTENEIRSFWKRSREKSLRALIDPATGDTFVWDAYLSEHNSMIRYFDLNIDWESDDGTYIRHVAHDVDISSLLQQQAETKQNPNIPVESGFYGPEDGHPKEYYTHNTDDKNLGNPNQRFMGRPKGPNRSNQEEVIKMIFEQDIDKKAFTINGFWVAPDGKSFDVRSSGSKTHGDWVMKNAKILQKYGIKDAAKRDYFEVAAEMLQKGWARVGDSQRNKFAAVGVEVNNIKSIPSGVDNVLATFLQDGDVVVVADLNGDWGEVTYPFKSLQSAINKARMGRSGSAYTQQQMEEIYVEQHEMHDDPGGGGGWTPNNYNNSSTDFPSPKDMQPVQVFLDKLDKTKTPPIPSYEVSWAISTPKE